MHRYGRILGYALREWRTLLVIVVLSMATSFMAALQPWPVKLLVDYGLQGFALPPQVADALRTLAIASSTSNLVVLAALASLVLFAVNSVIDVMLTWAWTSAGQRMVFALATDLFRRLQRLSLAFHHRRGIGDSLSRLSTDTWCVYTVTEGILIAPAQRLLTIATVGLVAWQLDAILAVCAFAVAPVLAISGFVFGRALKRRTKANREAQSRVATFVHQTLSAIPVVQAFRMERANRETFAHLAEGATRAAERDATLKSAFGSVNTVLITIGAAVVLFVGGERVLAQSLTIGTLLVFVGYLRTLQGAFEGLLGTYGQLRSVEASIDRVLEVLDERDEVPEAPDAVGLPEVAPGQRGHIVLENVSFAYEPHRPVLRNIDLDIRPGETVALVGHSGAGKTTLASLVPRLFDPVEGCVRLDGIDLRRLKLSALRSQIAVVLQDAFLLPLSVAENIAYGRPGASLHEIVTAAIAANAHEFIQELPQGYDTILGERGATLSGGQRQRLAIARAILKNAPVLILDEPTSALDPETESLIVAALQRLVHGRTTIIVAHRFSTIRNAGRIVVLDRGRIVESGSHADLMSRRGPYHALYAKQRGSQEKAVA